MAACIESLLGPGFPPWSHLHRFQTAREHSVDALALLLPVFSPYFFLYLVRVPCMSCWAI